MTAEIERRFLVRDYDKAFVLTSTKDHYDITQGYIDAPGKVRVRLWTSSRGTTHAEITRKVGKGLVRDEVSETIAPRAALMLLDSTPFTLRKIRHYLPGGWELDVFLGKLQGLVLAERECETVEEAKRLVLPSWIKDATEVTDTITNGRLAEISYHIADAAEAQEEVERAPIPKIVLTGGPCSGKSTILRALRDLMPEVHIMPETATILMDTVGITPHVAGPRVFQRTIFKVQRSFEEGAEKQARKLGKKVMLLDRGTVDSVAFTSGWEEFSEMTRTSADEEHDRYSAVLLCEVPPKEIYDAHVKDNPIRTETWEQSMQVQANLERAWVIGNGCDSYENFYRVPAYENFNEKIAMVKALVERFAS